MSTGIYKITCKETGRCYIGQSAQIKERWNGHYKKYAKSKFDYEILVTCPVADLDELEILMIETFDSFNNGFNETRGGAGFARRGTKLTDEHKAKISLSLIGNTRTLGRKLTDDHKAKVCTEESKKKISETKKNAPKFPCLHCSKSFKVSAFKRYHGDNCKMRGDK